MSNWQDNIIEELKSNQDFEEYAKYLEYLKYEHYSGKEADMVFMQQVAQNKSVYEYLDKLGLVNYGVCPITGESISDEQHGNYTIFGRTIYLSVDGHNICKDLRQKGSKLPVELLQKRKKEMKKLNLAVKLLSLLLIIIWWYYIDFDDVISYFWFVVACIFTYYIVNFPIWDLLFKYLRKFSKLW